MKALVISPDGSVEVKNLNGYKDFVTELDGGYIELLHLTDDAHAYLDEDGKSKNLPINQRATSLLQDELKIGLHPNDFIVGKLIILGCLNEDGIHDGEEYDIPEHLIKRIIGDE